jgi:amino acid adenylation domain-containing protein
MQCYPGLFAVRPRSTLSYMSAATCPPFSKESAISPACVHSVFALRVAETPSATAIRTDSAVWSYQDLDTYSNRIANKLLAAGVAPGCLVGLMLRRKPQAIAAILGILKAGAAYVPLEVSYPVERLRFMLGDTALQVIVIDDEPLPALGPLIDDAHTFINIEQIDAEGSEAPNISVDPADLAYVMYTSGSSGEPKGVMIEHRSIVRLVSNQNYVSISPDDRFLQVASLSFDASTFEIWGSLLNGACLVMMPAHTPSLRQIAETLERHQITTLLLTTGLFSALVEEFQTSFRNLKQLLVGGDALSPSHIGRAMEVMRNGSVINGYGPTESTTFACCHRVRLEDTTAASIPIGVPVAGTEIYILNQDLRPVSGQETGEIYIAGANLARGYLNRPELNQEKFVTHAFSCDASARMYRSGDMGRYNVQGKIEFLGRLDSQVKIRGFRIEISEVEIAAGSFPGISAAAVVVLNRDSADRSLCCFFVPRSGQSASGAEDLEAYLREKLPPYMVPAQFISIDRLPLNTNGKVDRAALPIPDFSSSGGQEELAPETEIQQALISILSGLLGGRPVKLQDNFFRLGGHSLHAAQLIARVRSLFAVDLPLQAVLEASTVADLSQAIEDEILVQLEACPSAGSSGNAPA